MSERTAHLRKPKELRKKLEPDGTQIGSIGADDEGDDCSCSVHHPPWTFAGSEDPMKREAGSVVLPESGFAPLGGKSSGADAGLIHVAHEESPAGLLIINADDWGLDRETTDHIFQCALRKTVSSVSAMVFMENSERAAATARESGIDAGLHLNLTTPFSASNCPARLAERQREIIACLRRNSFARVVFHPLLARSFKYVVEAQLEEFRRLYAAGPERIDGHHHMHLCSNVVFGGLLPRGILVRRNFSFQRGEKGLWNRSYRKFVDSALAKRHKMADYFFSLPPLTPRSRLERIFSLASECAVEVETHPARPGEYEFLMGDEILRLTKNVNVARRYAIPPPLHPGKSGR